MELDPSKRRRPRGVSTGRELDLLAKSAYPKVTIGPPDLVHITRVGWGRRILDRGVIDKTQCSVFGKELVYTFLARPAYRFKRGDEKSEQLNFFPFAIMLSTDALPAPYHVYPFDTGAFVNGVYDEVYDPSIYLEDYELEPSVEAALRHVEWAFGSNSAYFDAILKTALAETLPDWRAVARSWISIASLASVGRNRPDERSSAIELAFARSIDLNEGHAKLFVFPEQLLEDPRGTNTELLARVQSLGVPFATYQWRPNETPDSYMDEISDAVRRHLVAGVL